MRRATTARSAAVIGSESLGARKRAELLFFEDCDFVVIRRIMTSDRMLPISGYGGVTTAFLHIPFVIYECCLVLSIYSS